MLFNFVVSQCCDGREWRVSATRYVTHDTRSVTKLVLVPLSFAFEIYAGDGTGVDTTCQGCGANFPLESFEVADADVRELCELQESFDGTLIVGMQHG